VRSQFVSLPVAAAVWLGLAVSVVAVAVGGGFGCVLLAYDIVVASMLTPDVLRLNRIGRRLGVIALRRNIPLLGGLFACPGRLLTFEMRAGFIVNVVV
jgi:hypothetical protein